MCGVPSWEEMKPIRISKIALARGYLGKQIWYLCPEDIDNSGRGYYWPRHMRVDQVLRGEFHDIESGRYVTYKNIKMILVLEPLEKAKGE